MESSSGMLRVVPLLWLFVFIPGMAWGQISSSSTADSAQGPTVRRVDFEGNALFGDEELAEKVQTSPNRRFLGLPGLTWWRWIYSLGASGALGERVGRALMRTGEAPAYLEEDVLRADVERLRVFYQQEGFREAQVTARVDTLAGNERADVTFRIRPGRPTYIRRVQYEGLGRLAPERRRQLVRASLLEHEGEVTPPGFKAQKQRYSEPLLHEERRRVLSFLRNAGYADVTRDSIRALVFPQQTDRAGGQADSVDLTFRIRPGTRHRFGNVEVAVAGPEQDAPVRVDTLYFEGEGSGGHVSIRIEDESKVDPDLLARALRFAPGAWYDESKLQASKRRLESTGVFAFTDIMPAPADSTPRMTPADSVPRQPHRIELRTRPRHQLQFETFMLQRSGVLGGENELGAGVGVTYENVNLLGGGESFRLRNTASVAADTDLRLFTSAQAEVRASFIFPYLVAPFQWMDRRLSLYDARTRLSLSLLSARRDALNLIIRGRGNARMQLEMQHTAATTSLVDLLDLSLSSPDTLQGFRNKFLDPILQALEDPVQEARIVEDYTQPQINNAWRYALQVSTANPLRRSRGYSYEVAAEAGGYLAYLLDRWAFTSSTIEGSLPGLPVFRQRGTANRLLYRRYLRTVGDFRRYHRLGSSSVFAWKVVGGLAHPTGPSGLIPFDRRFYSGGASSVRGWRLRELGPGAAHFSADSIAATNAANLLGGDVKMEASVELRQGLLRQMLKARWIGVLFADVGNVWFGPDNPGFGRQTARTTTHQDLTEAGRFGWDDFYEELGVGSGIGLRLAWEYLIVRLDLAAKVYDPARQAAGVFPDGLDQPTLHFGIGHTF